MKKILLLIIIITSFQQTHACDLCGCNSGNFFIGPFPQFNRYFFGLRYSFEGYNTVLNSDNSQFSDDFFQTTEFLAGLRIKDRWQFLMSMPYHFYQSKSDDGFSTSNGLGDLSLIGNYNLIDKKYLNKDTVTVFQELWIGGGVKSPTGAYSVDTSELVSSANIQPGTGSFDFLLNLIYSYQIKSWGINFNASYRINEIKGNYKFGNRLNLSSFVFRNFHSGKVTISPNIGLMYEDLSPNSSYNETVTDTGGNIALTAIGSEFRFNDFAFGVNAQIPVYSDLSGGQTKAQVRAMCHVSYMF